MRWNGRSKPLPYRFDILSVENPYVFAVLFEAAKAKVPLCNNRACLAKNALAFFACNARSRGYIGGHSPYARFLWFVSLTRVKEMNKNLLRIERSVCTT